MDQPAGFCENCGSHMAADSSFCEKCGQPIEVQPDESQKGDEVNLPPSAPVNEIPDIGEESKAANPRAKKYLIGGGIAVAVILLAWASIQLLSKNTTQSQPPAATQSPVSPAPVVKEKTETDAPGDSPIEPEKSEGSGLSPKSVKITNHRDTKSSPTKKKHAGGEALSPKNNPPKQLGKYERASDEPVPQSSTAIKKNAGDNVQSPQYTPKGARNHYSKDDNYHRIDKIQPSK
ncbi:MAG: zinc ribbon domain-containing protein [Nitrospirae bacterium]|nr:MAG: zinc ribbon domain-containing protein [Nitrospirota bacterium]